MMPPNTASRLSRESPGRGDGAGDPRRPIVAFPGKPIIRRILATAVRARARCLFVLSTGRVGTVTLTHLLNLSENVFALHEPGPQFRKASRRAYEGALSGEENDEFFREFCGTRVRSLLRATTGSRIYAETANRLTFLAPVLAERLPKSRFIHLFRDPAAVVRSGMRREWYQNHPWDAQRIEPRADDRWAAEWNSWGAFEKCCWFWSSINEFCLDFAERLRPERVLPLSTEALFAPDGEAARKLFEWLGVEAGSPDEIRRAVGTRYNAQHGNDFPALSDWTNEQKSVFARIVGPVARRLGYDSFVGTA